jgi:hypothetical protein
LAAASAATVVPWSAAIAVRVSPDRTTYSFRGRGVAIDEHSAAGHSAARVIAPAMPSGTSRDRR